MARTYADIEARVQEMINSDVADVSIAIDQAIDFLGNFYENYKIDTSIATVANQDYIARPDGCKEVERLEIGGDEIKKGTVAQLQEIKDFDLERFIEYDGKINLYPTPDAIATTKIWYKALFTPLAGVAAAETDVPDQLIPLLVSIATWFFLEQQENMYDYEGSDGWISVTDAWTFLADADAPTFTITVPAGATGTYGVGMKIKLVQTTTKYFIITKVTNTVLTVYGGTDYALTNAIISQIKYSTNKCPKGFPMLRDKWTVLVSDVTNRTQAAPTNGVWYNLSNISISVPIGMWLLKYTAEIYATRATLGQTHVMCCLSDDVDTQSDADFHAEAFTTCQVNAVSAETGGIVSREKMLEIAVKTTKYFNLGAGGVGMDQVISVNANTNLKIQAICAYL